MQGGDFALNLIFEYLSKNGIDYSSSIKIGQEELSLKSDMKNVSLKSDKKKVSLNSDKKNVLLK
jgi:hypothetical protein